MISTTIQRPGTFFTFVFTSRQGGFTPLPQRIGLIGIQTAANVAAHSVNRILTPEGADALFGVGSELALMCRAAFDLGGIRGQLPEIYGIPLAAPSGGLEAAAVSTITVTGAATVAEDLVVRIAGRSIRVGVTPDSSTEDIAAAIKGEVDAQTQRMPVTAAVATNVVTCTHRSPGVNGNDVRFEATSVPSGLSVAIAQTTPGAGAADIADALDATLGTDFNALALANHTDTDTTAAHAHVEEATQPGVKRWRHIFLAETGSLATAQTLAAVNDYRLVVAGYRNSPSLPGELAAALAALTFSTEIPNYNFDREVLPIFQPAAEDAWTVPEVEALLAAGVTPISPGAIVGRSQVEKLVTTQVTKNGAPFLPLRDITVSLVGFFVARQIDAQYALVEPADLDGIRDLVIDVDRRAEERGFIRNVDELLPAITIEEDPVVPGRANVNNPIEPVVPLHQAVFTVRAAV